jgi:hypothetical protein
MRLAALLLTLVALLAGCGGGDDEAAPVTVTEQVTVTETVAETTAPGGAAATCSAADLSAALPDQDLPDAVAEVRQRIADAAVACDYDALQAIALEQDGFTFSYGAETSAADHWAGLEERGEDPLRTLVQLLSLPVTRNEAGAYAWPSAYTESPTEEDWAALEGIYSDEEIASFRAAGSYLGYRVGITPEGDWQFFVAGD